MNDVFELSMPWYAYALRGVATYIGLLVLMRLAGKRAFGEMTAFDVIVLVLVGGALRTAIIGDDKGVLGPFIGVAAILATDKVVAWLCTRWAWLNRMTEGYPAILVRDGKRQKEVMKRQNVPDAALDRALHGAGLESDHEVVTARLEPNGKITLVQRK
ncbi:DUF421 domain-containing protein [Bacillus sp. NP157]|nr:DUF421 domain-containing protein [Bacillus sp. NP157]